MTKKYAFFVRLAVAVGLVTLGGVYVSAQDWTPGTCYDLMIAKCNGEASANGGVGGYDAAYDACIADWYANSGCAKTGNSPFPTVGTAPLPVFAPVKRALPVRKQRN